MRESEERLALAKRLRRHVLREGGESLLQDQAEREFGMPSTALDFARQLEAQGKPLYEPVRSASN